MIRNNGLLTHRAFYDVTVMHRLYIYRNDENPVRSGPGVPEDMDK